MKTIKKAVIAIFASILLILTLYPSTSGAVSTSKTITSTGTISNPDFLSLNLPPTPVEKGENFLISGITKPLALITIDYSIDQIIWTKLPPITANAEGEFSIEVILQSSGVYALKVTTGILTKLFTQIVVDQVVNNSENIQNAINSLPPEGGTIYIESGIFDLKGGSIILRSNIELIGSGKDQTTLRLYQTLQEGSAAEDMITSTESLENVILRDFSLIQNVEQVNHHGGIVLRGNSNKNIIISNISVTNVSGAGIAINSGYNCIINNCYVDTSWTGITIINGTNTIIAENTVLNTVGDGIFPQRGAIDTIIENNYLQNIGDTAIDVTCYAPNINLRIIVKNNTIVNGTLRCTNSEDAKLINNQIFYGDIIVDAGGGPVKGLIVSENTVISDRATGIGFYGATNCSISNNNISIIQVDDLNQSGMVAAIWGSSLISYNTITGGNYGINFGGWGLGGSSTIMIANNIIKDYQKFGIYDDNKPVYFVTIKNNLFSSNSPDSLPIFFNETINQWKIEGNTF